MRKKLPEDKRRDYTLGISIEPPLMKTIERMAEREGRTLSAVGRNLILTALALEKKRRRKRGHN